MHLGGILPRVTTSHAKSSDLTTEQREYKKEPISDFDEKIDRNILQHYRTKPTHKI